MNILEKKAANRPHFASKLVAVIGAGVFGAMAFGSVHAQATDSAIFGKAPSDVTIVAHSDAGVNRHVGVKNGRYSLNHLPSGTYAVSLEKDGKTLANLAGAQLIVGRSFEVDFACDGDQCTVKPGH